MAVSFDILEEEQYNVFRLYQISSGTFLKDIAGVDYLEIPANSISEIHRHHEYCRPKYPEYRFGTETTL